MKTEAHKGKATAATLQKDRLKRFANYFCHISVLVLSLALIVFISYDTFAGIHFLHDRVYMTFQLWVCLAFLFDFFFELYLSDNRRHFISTHWFFFLISIPYLNLIHVGQWDLSAEAIYYLSFVPLVRGAYSLAMVAGYISANKATSIVASYAAILMSIIYFASLIFFRQEYPVNPDVDTFWDALWWAGMNVTTIGCNINPLTPAGKICGVILAASGMMMLPLLTTMIVNWVKNFNESQVRNSTQDDGGKES